MITDAREETFHRVLKAALAEAVREEWEEMASHPAEHPVSLRCRRRMKRILAGKREKRGSLKRLGIGILAALAALTMLGMAVPPIRERVSHMFFIWYDTHFGVGYEPEEPVPTYVEEVILPAWLPDGWEVREVSVSIAMADHILAGEDGGRIHFTQHPIVPNEDSDWFDNTDVTISTVLLNGTAEARLFSYADGRCTLTWADRYVFILTWTDETADADTLIRIAESMKQSKGY